MALCNFEKLIYKDQKKALQNKHKLAPTWDNHQTFRMVLAGPNGCGKTNTLLNMILRFMNFEEIHILTKDIHEPAYEFLQETLKPVEKKIKQKIVHMYDDKDDLPNPQDLDDESHKIIVFDDQVSEKDQSKIVDYFILGRKKNCGCFYLTQSFFSVPLKIRHNCNYFCLFNLPSDGDLCRISREIANDIPKDEFKRLMLKATEEKGGSILIDRKGDRDTPYRKNIIQPLRVNR